MIVAVITVSAGPVQSQNTPCNTVFNVITDQSRVGFEGSSSLHDFEGISHRVRGQLHLDPSFSLQCTPRASVRVRADSITTGLEARDEDMYHLLEVDRYPWIQYRLTRAAARSGADADTVQTFLTKGILSVAGETRPLKMTVTVSNPERNVYDITGKAELRMSDFGIEPPTSFYVLRTEDRVRIRVDLRVKPRSEADTAPRRR